MLNFGITQEQNHTIQCDLKKLKHDILWKTILNIPSEFMYTESITVFYLKISIYT